MAQVSTPTQDPKTPATPNFEQKNQDFIAKAPPTAAQTTQLDINKVLEPYINELQNLGPEYGAEMSYLQPYLTQSGAQAPQTFDSIVNESKAQESSTGNTAVNAADQAAGQAETSMQAPGFGQEAAAGKAFEGTVPYSQLLQDVLGAGKSEITYNPLGTIPNISTGDWPAGVQEAYNYLAAPLSAPGGTQGLPGIQAASNQLNQQQGGANTQAANLLSGSSSGLSGGGNAG